MKKKILLNIIMALIVFCCTSCSFYSEKKNAELYKITDKYVEIAKVSDIYIGLGGDSYIVDYTPDKIFRISMMVYDKKIQIRDSQSELKESSYSRLCKE